MSQFGEGTIHKGFYGLIKDLFKLKGITLADNG